MTTPATDMVPAVDGEIPPASIRRDRAIYGLGGDLTRGSGRICDLSRAVDYNSFASCGESARAARRARAVRAVRAAPRTLGPCAP